jgi:threonine 3-dehydrogenase
MCGQLGQALASDFRNRLGVDNVVGTDIRPPQDTEGYVDGPFEYLDVTDRDAFFKKVSDHRATHIVHLAAILSANGERNPDLALKLNVEGVKNALEAARHFNRFDKSLARTVFVPSTVAAFGPSSPKDAPDICYMDPTTIYGITKVFMEGLGRWHFLHHGIQFKCIRYPGVISKDTLPGGGTTDFADEVFHHVRAIQKGELTVNDPWQCYLREDSRLPFVYFTDLVKGTVDYILKEDAENTHRTYNMTGFSLTPGELVEAVQELIDFELKVDYRPDFRQKIADSWPDSLQDTNARNDWAWNPQVDMKKMAKILLDG